MSCDIRFGVESKHLNLEGESMAVIGTPEADSLKMGAMGFIKVSEEIRPALIQEMESKSAEEAGCIPPELVDILISNNQFFSEILESYMVRVPTGRTIKGMVHTQRILKDGWYLVELEDGTHTKSAPEEVTFIDSKGRFDEICWDARA